MSAGKWTPGPVVDRGADWRVSITFSDSAGDPIPVLAPGWMDIRTRPERTASLVARLDSTGTADGEVSFGPAPGQIVLTLSDTATTELTPGEYYFDVFVTNTAGGSERLVYGVIEVRAEVSLP